MKKYKIQFFFPDIPAAYAWKEINIEADTVWKAMIIGLKEIKKHSGIKNKHINNMRIIINKIGDPVI